MYISVNSPEQDIIVFNIPVIIAKKNQNAQGLNISNCIIENLPFVCEFSVMKEVVNGVLYHATWYTTRDDTQVIFMQNHDVFFQLLHIQLILQCLTSTIS